ncbi:MAG: hypothetical protein L0I76_02560 [Pseudonocardia sp.]|nr:hypothetical protein [Pseudonocardia sp.]
MGPSSTTANQLRAYFHDLAQVNSDEFATTRQLVVAWVRGGGPIEDDPWLANALVDCVRDGQRSGEIRASCDPFDAACLLRDAYLGVIFRWVRPVQDEIFDLTPVLDRSIDMVLEGVVGPGTAGPPAHHVGR